MSRWSWTIPALNGLSRKIAPSGRSPTPGCTPPDATTIEMSGHRLAAVRATSKPSGPPGISTSVNSRTIDPAYWSRSLIASTPFAADRAWKPASSRIVTASHRTRPSSSATNAYGEFDGFGMPVKSGPRPKVQITCSLRGRGDLDPDRASFTGRCGTPSPHHTSPRTTGSTWETHYADCSHRGARRPFYLRRRSGRGEGVYQGCYRWWHRRPLRRAWRCRRHGRLRRGPRLGEASRP
ncbi:hypothetical protein EKPJFOCH_3708 [Methylobacterium thuringiense]|uniref:Uncharacterized protein n=1 Tax=Methylobacterium thuringiense TaxID=1003091 RepID=A0ABQ4TTI4_9HYPH|nr:hypothetical protein EKPJFOCH_3708 [Methylobacterium thuringiense]